MQQGSSVGSSLKCLELFSGTGSVGKVCKELNIDVISVDIDGRADINCDILQFDYKAWEPGHFDIVHASPPCATFSALQYSHLGKNRNGKVFTREQLEEDMNTIGDPLVKKALEIIDYFQPKVWFIENPKTGRLKDREYMKDIPYYDVDYCMYSDWGYRKRTRIWTNNTEFQPKLCNKKCGNMIDTLHKSNLGNSDRLKRAEKALKNKGQVSGTTNRTSLDDRYRIPPILIKDLLLSSNLNK